MTLPSDISRNPFNITKANDLEIEQIESLWVDVSDDKVDTALLAAARPASPMPMLILGGKGSGKTHLLRYCSFPVQRMRHARSEGELLAGIQDDGYIGIYVRCSGLNSGRFSGKRQSDEIWRDVFSYYVELWLASQSLTVINELTHLVGEDADGRFTRRVRDLFNKEIPENVTTVTELSVYIGSLMRELDYHVDNATFTGHLPIDILATRGRLIFGIPRALAEAVPPLAHVSFVYEMDEFENLTREQQRHVNTLIREREAPATFKIGGRQFGIKTHSTFSADEENLRDSEFEELRLDQQFRDNKGTYNELARRLAMKRLEQHTDRQLGDEPGKLSELGGWFEEPDTSWQSDFYLKVCNEEEPAQRTHFRRLRKALENPTLNLEQLGIGETERLDSAVRALEVVGYPLLEKVNILLFYQDWSKGRDLYKSAHRIARDSEAFTSDTSQRGAYAQKLGHFKADLIAQMLKENRQKQLYAGVRTFVGMSEGLPRAFITLLKQTYDWSVLQRERPFQTGKISIEAQRRGAVSGADWFYNSMTKAGEDGPKILSAADRLGRLFQIHRFADKPIESSLIGFSVKQRDLSDEARHVLSVSLSRSFLLDIFGGQRERNSGDTTAKIQINRMLSPRWDLPVSRRGIAPFSTELAEAILCMDKEREFNAFEMEWSQRLNAPFRQTDGAAEGDISLPRFEIAQPSLL